MYCAASAALASDKFDVIADARAGTPKVMYILPAAAAAALQLLMLMMMTKMLLLLLQVDMFLVLLPCCLRCSYWVLLLIYG